MNYSTQAVAPGIVKCDVFSDTFKINNITLNFFWQLDKQYASKIALIAAVLKRGNNVFGEMDKISAYLDKNYGANLDISVSKAGEMQLLTVSASYIDDKFALDGEKISENMISLVKASIFDPITENGVFKESFVSSEKQNLKDRILSLINDKQSYSFEKCKQSMFANEKYGVYEHGDIEVLESITSKDLYEFYLEFLSKAMVVVNYGGSECDTNKLFAPVFEKLESPERISFTTLSGDAPENVNEVTEEMNVAQSKLNLGFRLGESAKNDLFALKMFNVIFGSSPTSKLFMNVREKLSLCYYCSSVADTIKNVMFVYSGVETKNADTAKEEILKQLSLMKDGDFSDEEFENARAYIIDSLVQAGDSAAALCALMTSAYVCGHNLTPPRQIDEIKKVTKDRVVKVAEDIKLDTVYLLRGIGGGSIAD